MCSYFKRRLRHAQHAWLVGFDDGFALHLNGRYVFSVNVINEKGQVEVADHEANGFEFFPLREYKNALKLGINVIGLEGAILQSLSHGFVASALFLIIGVVYERHHTRLVKYYGGLAQVMPLYTIVFLFFTMANIGLPGTSGFVGEFLILLGTFTAHRWWAVVATAGVVLAALYLLWAYQRVFHGPAEKENAEMTDLKTRETLVLLPLLALIVFLGIYPKPVINRMENSVKDLVVHIEKHVSGFEEPVNRHSLGEIKIDTQQADEGH